MSRPINGQDACSPDKPANLTLEKLKLHYVVHYMLRGTWSDIVPEEVDEGRIEAYKCNICQKKFKNNYDKKEFPARGSVICHIATDHGRLIEAMKKDTEINMQSVRVLSYYLSYYIRHELKIILQYNISLILIILYPGNTAAFETRNTVTYNRTMENQ